MESRQNLAENLKKYRLRQNMKMDEFARLSGYRQNFPLRTGKHARQLHAGHARRYRVAYGRPRVHAAREGHGPDADPGLRPHRRSVQLLYETADGSGQELAEHILRMGDILSSARGEEGASHE